MSCITVGYVFSNPYPWTTSQSFISLEHCLSSDTMDQQAIRDLVDKYLMARTKKDTVMIKSLFTWDADQLVSSGVWRRGQDQLVMGMLRSSDKNPGDRSLHVEKVRFLTSEVAIADARYLIKGRNGTPDRKMWSTFMAIREMDQWKIAAIRNMLPAP